MSEKASIITAGIRDMPILPTISVSDWMRESASPVSRFSARSVEMKSFLLSHAAALVSAKLLTKPE